MHKKLGKSGVEGRDYWQDITPTQGCSGAGSSSWSETKAWRLLSQYEYPAFLYEFWGERSACGNTYVNFLVRSMDVILRLFAQNQWY